MASREARHTASNMTNSPCPLRWAACLLDILLEDDWKICGWISVCNHLTINLFHLHSAQITTDGPYDSYESKKCAT